MSPPVHRRGPWSQAEDAYLLQLVHTQGAHNWVRISHIIGSRSPKQCRERYHQNLKPTLNHEPISPEEGILIERLVGEMGKRWAEIARRLHGRSDNAVKNWWNGGVNRRRRVGMRRSNENFDEQPSRPIVYEDLPQPMAFPRPITTTLRPGGMSSTQRPIAYDTPLPSPSNFSDISMDAAAPPSLVSDSGSTFSSSSPRLFPGSPSSAIELPPLIGTRAESRRPSLPILHLGSTNFVHDNAESCDAPHAWGKTPLTPQPGISRRPDVLWTTLGQQLQPQRYQSHAYPSQKVEDHQMHQLPPLQNLAEIAAERERAEEKRNRDKRMSLSTLLD